LGIDSRELKTCVKNKCIHKLSIWKRWHTQVYLFSSSRDSQRLNKKDRKKKTSWFRTPQYCGIVVQCLICPFPTKEGQVGLMFPSSLSKYNPGRPIPPPDQIGVFTKRRPDTATGINWEPY
jgi:hypothetical protein